MLVRARPIHVLASVLILFWTSSPSAASTIYVARRGWHIDVGMDVADLAASLEATAAHLPGARYIFFGFGDRHYLAAKKHNAPVLLSSMWPGGGIVLVTALSASPGEAFGASHVTSLTVSAEQMQALQSFIWTSLETRDGVLDPMKTASISLLRQNILRYTLAIPGPRRRCGPPGFTFTPQASFSPANSGGKCDASSARSALRPELPCSNPSP
jgi:Protein of unknown function (DUF2459)